MIATTIIALLLLAVSPASAQIGVTIDAETARAIQELDLARFVIIFEAIVVSIVTGVGARVIWSQQRSARESLAAAERAEIARGKAEDREAEARTRLEELNRVERAANLELLWKMQATQVSTQGAIAESNARTAKQTDVLEGMVAILQTHNVEAKDRHDETVRNFAELRAVITDGNSTLAQAITDAMISSAKVQSQMQTEAIAQVVAPLIDKLERIDGRIASVKKDTGELKAPKESATNGDGTIRVLDKNDKNGDKNA